MSYSFSIIGIIVLFAVIVCIAIGIGLTVYAILHFMKKRQRNRD